ncbi:MAG: Uncharacterised protein [Cryomorphaceae bacterium]|jgi:hypothetical protein|nr:MAG: Uncharacterised protein [Cryomorphaceae bacterium]
MPFIQIKRKTLVEPRYHKNMGRIVVPVTKIQKTFLGIPIQTLHKYRETYHGRVKSCKSCELARV